MGPASPSNRPRLRLTHAAVGLLSFGLGLFIGLPVLGWWLWPVQWTDLPPLPTYTPYPTYTSPPPTATTPPEPTATPIPDAIVVAPVLDLRDGPALDYAVTGQAAQGQPLQVIGQFAGCAWVQVVAASAAASAAAPAAGWAPLDPATLQLNAPCVAIPHGAFRPFTGVLQQDLGGGLGELSVENGSARDHLLVITTAAEPARAAARLYVRAGEALTVTGLPDGVYRLYFSSGEAWDGDERRFTQDARFGRFQDTFAYTTTATQYTTWSVTLHPVVGGTAETEAVAPDEFPLTP